MTCKNATFTIEHYYIEDNQSQLRLKSDLQMCSAAFYPPRDRIEHKNATFIIEHYYIEDNQIN